MKILKFCDSRETAQAIANRLRSHSEGHEMVVVPDGGRFAVCVDARKIPASLKAALRELQRIESRKPAPSGRTVDEVLQSLREKKGPAEEVSEKPDAEKLRELLG